ncbi:MAG: hypothetical protein ACI867_002028, partial [Glaciecola sp.]
MAQYSRLHPVDGVCVARRDRKKAANRQQLAVERAGARVGRPNADAARETREALAALAPSAARVLLMTDDGPRSVDPVATALGLARGLLSLQGSGAELTRTRCSLVHQALVSVDPMLVPSGLSLAEVFEVDRGTLPQASLDGALTVAEQLAVMGRRHDAGDLDLYGRTAPLGLDRHRFADEIDAVCAAMLAEDLAGDEGRPRLVLVIEDGWFELWPSSAMQAASVGFLAGDVADVVGQGLYAWLTGPTADEYARAGVDALPQLFGGVDIRALVQAAAGRAGSDHPSVA